MTPEMQVGSGGLPDRAIQLHLAFWLITAIYPLGYGGLSLSIEGPSKVDINTEDLEDGTCRVTYCPTEPGNYIINIKFADQHVPGECGSHTPVVWQPLNTPQCPPVIYAGYGLSFIFPTGSPFSVKVTGEGRVKESITRRRRAPSVANVGSHCDLSLKIPGREKIRRVPRVTLSTSRDRILLSKLSSTCRN